MPLEYLRNLNSLNYRLKASERLLSRTEIKLKIVMPKTQEIQTESLNSTAQALLSQVKPSAAKLENSNKGDLSRI